MKTSIRKIGTLLQALGLATFWFGSMLLFTWTRFGTWVALAGVVLCLSDLFLQRRTTSDLAETAGTESLELRPSLRHFVRELARQQTAVTFGLALGMSVVGSGLWYATGTFGPLKWEEAHREAMTTFSNVVMPLTFGFVVGVLPGAYAFQKAMLLTVLMAAVGGIVHWVAGRSGIQIDWSTWDGSMMLAFLGLLFSLPLTTFGFVVGRAVTHIARRARPELRS